MSGASVDRGGSSAQRPPLDRKRNVPCAQCSGTASDPRTYANYCEGCGGSGLVPVRPSEVLRALTDEQREALFDVLDAAADRAHPHTELWRMVDAICGRADDVPMG